MGSITRNFANSIGSGQTIDTGTNFRNLVINGDMEVSQRGTTFTSIGNTAFGIDRWKFYKNSLGDHDMTQDTSVPTGQGFTKSLKLTTTTADASPAGGDYVFLIHPIEGMNLQKLKYGTSSAENVVMSFWVKSNKTGTFGVETQIQSGGSSYERTEDVSINSADTWEKKSFTLPKNTAHTIDDGDVLGMSLVFWLNAGSTYTGTAHATWADQASAGRAGTSTLGYGETLSDYINITGVQLEVGSSATEFEFVPYYENLRRCQRYYETFNLGSPGIAYATDSLDFPIRFQTPKRATPSGTLIDTSITTDRAAVGAYTSSGSVIQGALYSTTGAAVRLNGWTGLTNTLAMYTTYQTGDWIAFSSEL